MITLKNICGKNKGFTFVNEEQIAYILSLEVKPGADIQPRAEIVFTNGAESLFVLETPEQILELISKKCKKTIPRESVAMLMDIFEDFLDQKGVKLENPEKSGEEGEAIIFGSDFDELMTGIIDTLEKGGVKVPESY